eukprot:g517.t1
MARTKPAPSLMVTRSSRTMTRSRTAKKREQSPPPVIPKPVKKPPTKKSKTRSARKPPPRKAKLYTVGKKVRVWWPPTRNKKRTDFSGAYWPAKVIDCYPGGVRVEYDNKETEDVDCEDISPSSLPVEFGEEKTRLTEKEFCEVFNESATDPSSWLAQIASVGKGNYTIHFPFHDSEPETVIASRVRRARVFHETSRTWKLIKPDQEWEDGEISSPLELELIEEQDISKALAQLQEPGTMAEPVVKLENGEKSRNMESIMSGIQNKPTVNSATTSMTGFSDAKIQASLSHPVRKKKRRDPNKPKKPKSSYVYFMEQYRQEVKEENPNLRPQHIMKLMGERWTKLPEEERERFEELSKSDRVRYQEEMKDYTSPDETLDEPGAKRSRTEIYKLPKSPPTAFRIFSKELRKKLGSDLNADEKTKRVAQAWRDATVMERQKYHDLANEERQFHEQERAKYEALLIQQQEQKDLTQGSSLLQSLGNVGMVGFQPPPLTRTVTSIPIVDEDSKKILEGFILGKVKSSILETLLEEAYYMLLDVWREGSERLGDAIRAYKAHVDGQEDPDWRAFFTAIFGSEITNSLLRPAPIVPPEEPIPAPEEPVVTSDEVTGLQTFP